MKIFVVNTLMQNLTVDIFYFPGEIPLILKFTNYAFLQFI